MYFWDGKQVIHESREILITDCQPYLNMPCCDDSSDDLTYGRYGVFLDGHSRGHSWNYYWQGGRIDRLPIEFRANLLLLGVT